MSARVIRLSPEWAQRVEAVERQSFTAPWTLGMIGDALESDRCATFGVVEEGDRLCGYLTLSWVLDEGCVDNVAVAPDCRRRGYGALLLDAALAEARRLALASVTLEVRASNSPAQNLYTRFGFAAVGRRPRYYTLPEEDAILMTKGMNE